MKTRLERYSCACGAVCLLSILLPIAGAVEIPPGTALSVRQQARVGTKFSKVGDPVTAVLLATVWEQDRAVLPAGSELDGIVTMVRRMGLGFKYETASLALDFYSIRLPGGKQLSIDARMKHVETAREWVDRDGRIHGIRPVTNASSSLAVAAWRLMIIAPGVGLPVWATKLLFAPAPDTEITFERGTEYRIELARPLTVGDDEIVASALPTHPLGEQTRAEIRTVMDSVPSQRAAKVSGGAADLVNLILVGSSADVTRAFEAAGWSTSDRKDAGSVIHTYFSFMLRSGYEKAPMTTMVLDGNRPDIELEKGLDTFTKRHHIRIWRRPESQGESIWAAAATEDTGIKFSVHARTFAHAIDGNVDRERTKVVDDLLYTGCVSEAGLAQRDNLPTHLENGTGTKLETDGRIAVLRIGECDEPRVMPGTGALERTGVARLIGSSLRTELIRSNFISLAYNGVRLTSATRRSLFGKPERDETGAALTRQQVAWLAEKEPGAGQAAVAGTAP